MKNYKIISIISILTIIDLIIKVIVDNYLKHITIIKNFFSLTYVKNYGAAWGIFDNKQYFLILIAIIFLFFIIKEIKQNKEDKIKILGYILITSGLLGNLINRFIYGYVIDYLSFKIINYNYPVFNLADILIVLGVFIVIIKELRGDLNEI